MIDLCRQSGAVLPFVSGNLDLVRLSLGTISRCSLFLCSATLGLNRSVATKTVMFDNLPRIYLYILNDSPPLAGITLPLTIQIQGYKWKPPIAQSHQRRQSCHQISVQFPLVSPLSLSRTGTKGVRGFHREIICLWFAGACHDRKLVLKHGRQRVVIMQLPMTNSSR